MNIYRQLAENVWNPRVQSGADIQRMLDMMDQFQSGPVTSNINSVMQPQQFPGQFPEYGGESPPSPALEGQMSDDPNALSILGYGLFGIPSQAGKAAFPSPTTTVGKAVSFTGKTAAGYLGIPGWAATLGMRQFGNPLISAIEGLLGFGNKGLSFVEAMNMADAMAGGRMGLTAPNMSMTDAMGMLGMGMGGLGSVPGSFSSGFSPDQFGMIDFGMDAPGGSLGGSIGDTYGGGSIGDNGDDGGMW